ncbi:hypothetical protein ACFL27_04290 [candidate division CSSED10-310 bacterium]|uniref:Amidohydrolase n=1 Tax=candidate division CSSED10-310 bacterium TaxID=2855610 RepID=A0ABV6YT77_UNCC1
MLTTKISSSARGVSPNAYQFIMEIRAARISCLPPVDDHFHLWGWADWLPAHAGLKL